MSGRNKTVVRPLDLRVRQSHPEEDDRHVSDAGRGVDIAGAESARLSPLSRLLLRERELLRRQIRRLLRAGGLLREKSDRRRCAALRAEGGVQVFRDGPVPGSRFRHRPGRRSPERHRQTDARAERIVGTFVGLL